MDEMGIEQARGNLGEIVDRARFTGEATMITRQGKPAAVIVPVEWYEAAKAVTSEKKGQNGAQDQ